MYLYKMAEQIYRRQIFLYWSDTQLILTMLQSSNGKLSVILSWTVETETTHGGGG